LNNIFINVYYTIKIFMFQGTSIQDLQRNESGGNVDFGNSGMGSGMDSGGGMGGGQYSPSPPSQFMPNRPSGMQNNQQNYPRQSQFQQSQPPQQQPQQVQFNEPNQQYSQESYNIEHLARDIDNKLSTEPFESTKNGDTYTETEEDPDIELKKKKPLKKKTIETGGILSKIPEPFREPLILIVLYSIMSHPKVKNGVAKYIPQINSDSDEGGYVVGVLVYAVILATLFIVAKKLLIKW
jgi:hypothetical protein